MIKGNDQQKLTIRTRGEDFVEFTDDLADFVRAAGMKHGLVQAFLQHTSASLIITENADPKVRQDLIDLFADLAPTTRDYRHADEGPDDMPAHIKSVLTQCSLLIPVRNGQLQLGTWQGAYLWEHRTAAHSRTIILSAISLA